MSHEYRNQLDIQNNKTIDELLDEMPVFMEDFVVHLNVKGLSTNTIRSYMYEVNVFLRYIATLNKYENIKEIQVTDLDKLTMSKIEAYVAKSEDGKKLTDPAIRRKISVLKTLYKYYIGIGSIKNNPTLLISGGRLKEKDVITLSKSQIDSLFNCILNQSGVKDHSKAYSEKLIYRDLAIVMTLLGTGMRISELVGLNISDFDCTDPVNPVFHIIRKGGDDDKVYFIEQVKNAIEEYLIYTRPLLSPSEEENALFLSTQSKRMGVSAIEKMMKKYCKAANLPDNISPHKLRATFATTVYSKTKDVYAVKDALHHKNIDTSKHYISDKTERKQKAANAVGDLLS